MWDPGAMSWSRHRGHGAKVEGMGAMEWSGRSGAGSSHLIDRGMGPRGHGKRAWRGRVCGWWQPCETWGHELQPLKECQNMHEGAMWDHGAMSRGVEGMGAM